MTVQATAYRGLLLCGALYVGQEHSVLRVVVLLTICFTAVLLCVRRALWRRVVYNRFREGLETRNVLIVGAGRVAHACAITWSRFGISDSVSRVLSR